MLERGLLATAVLLVLGVAYVMRDAVPAGIRNLVTGSREADPARQAAKPSPDTKQAVRADRGLRGKAPRPAKLEAMEAMNEPVPTTVVTVPIPPFPEAAAVRPGMSRGEVVRRFGSPNWKATWAESGTLHEDYTYVDHERATELSIQAGRVVTSQTGAAFESAFRLADQD